MVSGISGIEYNIRKANRTDGRVQNLAAHIDKEALMAIHRKMNSDKASGIDKVTTTFEQGAPGPYMEDEYDLRVNSDGEYLYVAREYDDTSVSDEVTIYYYVMSLSNGKLRANHIATEIRTTDASGKVSSRYGDDEFEMTENEFKQKTDTGLPKVEHIQKVKWGDADSVAGMNDAKALEAICFRLAK